MPPRTTPPVDLAPMLATATDRLPASGTWAYEIKWDGIRALVRVDAQGVRITSRNANDITGRYPEVAGLADALGGHAAVLDGELVALDREGRPSFQALQQRMHVDDTTARRLAREHPAVFMAFDLLWLDGELLTGLAWRERRARLEALELRGPAWQTPPSHVDDGTAMLATARDRGLEGVVAKRVDAVYEPGRRSSAWRKLKVHRRQELVVGGWQDGTGGRRPTFGSLLLGYHDGDDLVYAGKVGTGLSERELTRIRSLLDERQRATSPFDRGVVPRRVHFVEPDLVAEVRFSEWTTDGRVRHPVYVGLRDDRDPRTVVRE